MQHHSDEDQAEFAHWVGLAHAQALKSEAEGGIPIGAVLIHAPSKRLLGAGHNQRVQRSSNILHGEMDCFESVGRVLDDQPVPWHETICVTTLSPCLMCTGAILMYGIPHVIIAENENYLSPGEELLKSRNVKVTVLNDTNCKQRMQEWIAKNPVIWHEDVAGNVKGARC